MGRESENLAPGAGEPPSAADTHKVSGAAVGGLHGEHDCRSGTKGQPPLVFPCADRSPGEGCGASEPTPRSGASACVPRGTPSLSQLPPPDAGESFD
jgi:hypothetical protein